jgi:signal transduction histidine kinase
MGPGLAFFAGAALVAAVSTPLLFWLWRRNLIAGKDCAELRAEVETAGEILGTVPDGYLLRDAISGTTVCSRRLAILLGLPGGTESRFEDLLTRFDKKTAETLFDQTEQLARDGQGFSIILPVAGNGRTLQIVGIRAVRPGGEAAADILWFRDLSTGAHPQKGAAESPTPDDRTLQALLQALPFPAIISTADGETAFANDASKNTEAPGVTTESDGTAEFFLPNGSRVRLAVPAAMPSESSGSDQSSTVWFRILESVPTAISVFDGQARLQFSNSAFAGLWRLDSEWLATGPRLGDILDRLREDRRLPEAPDYAAFREGQVAEAKNPGSPSESLMHLPDGRTLRRTIAPNPGGGAVIAFDDLSERLTLERSLNELNAVQRETLDNLFEGIAVFAADGGLRLSNPAFARLWGFENNDDVHVMHVGTFVDTALSFLPEAGTNGADGLMTTARLMSRTSQTGHVERNDGKIVEFATVPLPDGAVLISFLDITDSARVEQALRQRAEALDAANRLKSEFIANVSYEIRTPLTTLMGFAEILTEQYFGDLNRRQMEYGKGILDSSRNLMSVVNDILDLAGIEAGIMALELDTIDVHTLLAAVLKLVRERTRHKNLAIDFDCATDTGWIIADEKRLKQVIFNLMSNAIRFSPRNGKIGLSAVRGDGEIVITVSDSGPGMDPETIDRLIEPFRRGETAESRSQGSGLGLSLVTRFVELHGGRVDIRTAPGRGTSVDCRLPTGEAGTTEPENGPLAIIETPD